MSLGSQVHVSHTVSREPFVHHVKGWWTSPAFIVLLGKENPPALGGAKRVDMGNSFSGMKVWVRRRQEGSLWVAAAEPFPRSTILDACLMHLASCLANVLSSLAWYSCSPSGEGTSSHEARILVKLTNGLKKPNNVLLLTCDSRSLKSNPSVSMAVWLSAVAWEVSEVDPAVFR